MYSLFDGERFTGFVAPGEERALRERAEPILGGAGSVCLMHTRLAHGSEPQSVGVAAGVVYLRLQCGGRRPHRAQSHAEPERRA